MERLDGCVSVIVNHVVEKCRESRQLAGTLLLQLITDGLLTVDQFVSGSAMLLLLSLEMMSSLNVIKCHCTLHHHQHSGDNATLLFKMSVEDDGHDYASCNCMCAISQLPKFCVKISILMHRRMWVRSFSTGLTSVTFAEDKVLIFLILRKNAKIVQLLSLTIILTLISRAD